MELSKTDLGILVELLRVAKGLKPGEIAKLGGMTPSALSAWEEGEKTPRWQNLNRLLEAMGYPYAALDEAVKFLARVRALSASEVAEPASIYGRQQTTSINLLNARVQQAIALSHRAHGELIGVVVELLDLTRAAESKAENEV